MTQTHIHTNLSASSYIEATDLEPAAYFASFSYLLTVNTLMTISVMQEFANLGRYDGNQTPECHCDRLAEILIVIELDSFVVLPKRLFPLFVAMMSHT